MVSKNISSFHQDLKRGINIEEKVLKKIQQKYPMAERVDGYCKEYDIAIPEIKQKIEVKYDPMSNKTNRILIEIEMNNKPSALLTTDAHWWVFYDDKRFYWIKPLKIFQCIMINNLRWTEGVSKGDTVSKKRYLIDKDLLLSYSENDHE